MSLESMMKERDDNEKWLQTNDNRKQILPKTFASHQKKNSELEYEIQRILGA
jgi:hypothetical protein